MARCMEPGQRRDRRAWRLDFDGPDDYVECPDQPSLNPTEAISVCAWLRQRTVLSSGGADDVLSKEEWGGGTGRGFVAAPR